MRNILTVLSNSTSEYHSIKMVRYRSTLILFAIYAILFFIFFQEPFISIFPNTYTKYIDEMFVVIVLSATILYSIISSKVAPLFLITLFAICYMVIISYLGTPRSLSTIVGQAIIHWKFFIFSIVFIYISKQDPDSHSLRYFFLLLFTISLVGFFMNWTFQEQFLEFFNTKPMYRNDILRVEGFQLKPNDLALHLSIVYLYIVLLTKNSQSDFFLLSASLIFFPIIYMTGSRTALSIIPITLSMYVLLRRKWAAMAVISVAVSIILVYFNEDLAHMIEMTKDNISEIGNIESTKYIRGIMIFYGAKQMVANFPIGTGSATFGTVESKESPVYDDLGLSGMNFFEDMIGIYDSNLASIMGEFGFFGVLLFYFSLFTVYHRAVLVSGGNSNKRLYLIILLFFSLFVSIVNPLFMYSYNGLLFAMAFFLVGIRDERNRFNSIDVSIDIELKVERSR